jgi:tetratricopeptide (TPR) repeat protein
MKSWKNTRCSLIYGSLLLGLLQAQEAPQTAAEEAQKKLREAIASYQADDYEAALRRTEEAEKLEATNPDIANVRGAIYVKQQQWDLATAQFNKALTLNPKHFPAQFNLGEVSFLQKKYGASRLVFRPLYDADPNNELLVYKIFLTYLLEGNEPESTTWLKKMDFTGKTPAYYFAQAAWHFHRQEEAAAQGYVSSAVSIYGPAANNLFAEPLIHVGWLKRPAAGVNSK